MSLLEKASGGKKGKNANSRNRTSLFQRAMEASSLEGRPRVQDQPAPDQLPATIAASVAIGADELEALKDKLHSIRPAQDAMLAAWSLLSSGLPLQALSLFLPRGDFLTPAAQIGFPSGKIDDIPISIAPDLERRGCLLEDEAKALVAPVLGVKIALPLRAVSMLSETGILGLWIFHDDAFEKWPEDARSRMSEFLSDAALPLPRLDLVASSSAPASVILPKLARYRYATAIRFDIGSSFSDSSACRGISSGALRAAFYQAFEKILDQTGAVLTFGEDSVAGFLGASSKGDPDLSLFQVAKTIKRSLPFLSAEAFPTGSAMGFDLSSDLVSEDLSRFLA